MWVVLPGKSDFADNVCVAIQLSQICEAAAVSGVVQFDSVVAESSCYCADVRASRDMKDIAPVTRVEVSLEHVHSIQTATRIVGNRALGCSRLLQASSQLLFC